MMARYALIFLLLGLPLLLPVNGFAFDLQSIRQEPNLERRSERAMDNAGAALDAARTAYQVGNQEAVRRSIEEVAASADLAYDSLNESGKDARRSPKFFKKAELSARQLLRRIDGFKEAMSFDERVTIEKARERVSSIHEELIRLIMAPRKK
jgi:hypothetical protein